jgi:hypothetical protein
VLSGWAEYVAHLQIKERACSVLHREMHDARKNENKGARSRMMQLYGMKFFFNRNVYWFIALQVQPISKPVGVGG